MCPEPTVLGLAIYGLTWPLLGGGKNQQLSRKLLKSFSVDIDAVTNKHQIQNNKL